MKYLGEIIATKVFLSIINLFKAISSPQFNALCYSDPSKHLFVQSQQ